MAGPRILGQIAGDAGTLLAYQAPANIGGAAVSTVAFVNTSSSAVTCSLSTAPKTGTPGDLHVLLTPFSLPAGATALCQLGISIGPEQRVLVACPAGAHVHVYGTEL